MQADNVLDMPNDLDSLELDMNNWLSLTYDQRKKSDDACIARYGCNNIQLYNMLKAKLMNVDLSDFEKETTLEQFIIHNRRVLKEANVSAQDIDLPAGFTATGLLNDKLNKISAGNDVSKIDNALVVINDFLDDRHPDYTPEDLEAKYNKYLNSNPDKKRLSDSYSMKIWGDSVFNMYTAMKAKFDTLKDPKAEDDTSIQEFVPSKEDQDLENFKNTVMDEFAINNDNLEMLVRKFECLDSNKSRSLYENYVLEQFGKTIKVGKYTYRQDMPGVMPFLTYYEYLHNTNGLDEKKLVGGRAFQYVLNKIHSREELKEAWNAGDKEKLLELGWNPYVKPTNENIEYAREKQIKWFDEHYGFQMYDISKFYTNKPDELLEANSVKNEALQPIFITVDMSKAKNIIKSKLLEKILNPHNYFNMGISMTSTLDTVYRYTEVSKGNPNKLEIFNLEKDYNVKATIQVLAIFVHRSIKAKIKNGLKSYMINQDNSVYAFDNVTTIVDDKPRLKSYSIYILMADFLDSIFKICNIYDEIDNITPVNKKGIKESKKIYILYNDVMSKYKSSKIDKKIKWLLKNVEYTDMNFFDTDHLSNFEYYTFDKYLAKYDNPALQEVANEIRSCLTPTAFINEISDYELTVEDYDTMVDRYTTAHELLATYDQTNIDGMKKQIASLYYLSAIVNKAIDSISKDDPRMINYNTLNNSINNDIRTYYVVIKQVDHEFNLDDYINHSEYEGRQVVINDKIFKFSSDKFKVNPI